MAAGSTYKQCGCREGGKRLGQQCPKLRRGNGTWSPVHGSWYYQLELPPRADGHRRPPLRRGGFGTQTDAEGELRQARELLAIAAPSDTETAVRIADAIASSVRDTRQLPDPARVRKAIGGGHDPAVRPPTVGEWLEEWLAAKKRLRAGTDVERLLNHPVDCNISLGASMSYQVAIMVFSDRWNSRVMQRPARGLVACLALGGAAGRPRRRLRLSDIRR